MKQGLALKISRILGVSQRLVEEGLGITKPNVARIMAIQTTEEIFSLLSNVETGSAEEALLYKRWDFVSFEEAKRAKNVDEVRRVYEQLAREHSEGWIFALIQWDDFSCKEVRNARRLNEVRTALNRAPYGGDAEMRGELKWDRFSIKEVRAATTILALKKAYRRARPGSRPQASAIRKIAKLLNKDQ